MVEGACCCEGAIEPEPKKPSLAVDERETEVWLERVDEWAVGPRSNATAVQKASAAEQTITSFARAARARAAAMREVPAVGSMRPWKRPLLRAI